MVREDDWTKPSKPWKKFRKKREKKRPEKKGRNRQPDYEERGLRQIRKDKKNDQIDWRELLMEEEEHELDDG